MTMYLAQGKQTWCVGIRHKRFKDKKFINFKASGVQCTMQILLLFVSK